MKVLPNEIPGLLVIEPDRHGDERGFFMETWQQRRYAEAGIDLPFVQDNLSRSRTGTLRGLHYQLRQPQGKLVSVLSGAVYDVAVDLRRASATFGRWMGIELSAENGRQLWVPPGFAHGFLVLSETADFMYKCTDYYAPEHERCIRWDDPDLDIHWPLVGEREPMLSTKDRAGIRFRDAEVFE